MLDRRDVAGGSTSASTSMLQYEIDELLIDLTDALGGEAASTAYRACNRGIDLVERATQAVGHNCGFRRSPSVFTAVKRRDIATLQRELDARAGAGFAVRWLDDGQLLDRWGARRVRRNRVRSGASVDPYQLAYQPFTLNSSFALVSEPIPTLDTRYPDGLLF